MATGEVRDLKSKVELEKAVAGGHTVVLHFWASWCEASKHLDVVFAQLASDTPHASFFRVRHCYPIHVLSVLSCKHPCRPACPIACLLACSLSTCVRP